MSFAHRQICKMFWLKYRREGAQGTFIVAYFSTRRGNDSARENGVRACCLANKNLLFDLNEQKKYPSLADDKQPYLCFLRDGEGEFFVGRGIVGCHVGAPRRTAAANGTVKGSDRTPRRRRPITNRIPASGRFALSWGTENISATLERCAQRV